MEVGKPAVEWTQAIAMQASSTADFATFLQVIGGKQLPVSGYPLPGD